MAKCGICGMETKQNPNITEEGKCNVCDQKLVMQGKCKQQQ